MHSLGYGKEEYFWGFLVAVLLFFLGGCFSIYEAVHKFMHPEPIGSYVYFFTVLLAAMIIEYRSFSVAFREFRKSSPKGLIKPLKDSTNTNLFVILTEDFSALTGLSIVLVTTSSFEDFSRGHAIETASEQIRSDIDDKYPHANYIYIDVRPGNC